MSRRITNRTATGIQTVAVRSSSFSESACTPGKVRSVSSSCGPFCGRERMQQIGNCLAKAPIAAKGEYRLPASAVRSQKNCKLHPERATLQQYAAIQAHSRTG